MQANKGFPAAIDDAESGTIVGRVDGKLEPVSPPSTALEAGQRHAMAELSVVWIVAGEIDREQARFRAHPNSLSSGLKRMKRPAPSVAQNHSRRR